MKNNIKNPSNTQPYIRILQDVECSKVILQKQLPKVIKSTHYEQQFYGSKKKNLARFLRRLLYFCLLMTVTRCQDLPAKIVIYDMKQTYIQINEQSNNN